KNGRGKSRHEFLRCLGGFPRTLTSRRRRTDALTAKSLGSSLVSLSASAAIARASSGCPTDAKYHAWRAAMRALIRFGLKPPPVLRITAWAAYRGPKRNAQHPSIHVVRGTRRAAFAAHASPKTPSETARTSPRR